MRGITYLTNSNSDVGVHPITVEATGPDGVASSTVFNIIVSEDCTLQIITPPELEA